MKFPRPAAGARPPLLIVALPFLAAAGCDRPAPPAPAAAVNGTNMDNADPAAPPAAVAAEPAFAPFTDPAGRRWLTKSIPYDAFGTADAAPAASVPARPAAADLLVGVGRGTVAGSAVLPGDRAGARGAVGMPGMKGPGMNADEPTDGWAAVISAEDLRDEIARARNAAAAAVGTVAAFNRATDTLPAEAAVLAATAQIAAEHPGRVPWKQYADAVRTLAVRVGRVAGSRGRPARDAARASFDPLDSILGGNPPPDDAVENFDRATDADRASLMKRMQTALDALRQDAPDAAALARGGDELARQASVLAALAKFTADPAYDGAANDDYQTWSAELTTAATEAARFARDEPDLAAYAAAVGRAATTCAACHAEYRL